MRKILLLFPFFLWTCNGGGGSTEPEPPQLPTVTNIEVTTLEDTAKTFTLTGTEPNNLALTYSISSQPQHGTISISGGAATYSPNANYHGQDVIAYLASSTNGNSNIGTIIITITPVDDEPNTMDVTATTDEDNSVTLTLEAEEYDGENIEFQVRNNPSNGSATISGITATYTPNQDWYGTDQFNFEAVDSSNRNVLNVATVTITVNPINDAPTVDDISNVEVSNGQSIDITLTGSDVENDNLTFEIVDSPKNGTVSISGNNTTFNANTVGSDTFTYRATDGTDESNVATVYISISNGSRFEKTFGGNNSDWANSVQETSDKGYIFTGMTLSYGSGTEDIYLIKTDIFGVKEWDKTFGKSYEKNYSSSVQQAFDEGYILAGSSQCLICTDYDIYLIKTDSSGNLEWDQTFGGSDNDWANSVQQTSDGSYILTGRTKSFGNGNFDIYLVKIDSEGNRIF